MYRIVASDMDGTFLTEEHVLPQANIDAVLRMRELGVLFVPASGRPMPSILYTIRDLPPEALEGSYVLSYNGGVVHKVGNPEPLYANTLPFEVVDRIFQWGLTQDVGFHVYETGGKVWGHRMAQEEVDYLVGSMEWEPIGGDSIEFLRDVPISKILLTHEGLDFLEDLRARVPEEVSAGTSTTISSRRYLEFNPQGVSKGTGIKWLADYLGIDIADVIGCGDALNDLEMIETVGCGVVVANATDDVRAVANYQARSTCEDGVFAEVLTELIEPQHRP